MLCINYRATYAVARCPSVCLFVRSFVTFMYPVETNKHIFNFCHHSSFSTPTLVRSFSASRRSTTSGVTSASIAVSSAVRKQVRQWKRWIDLGAELARRAPVRSTIQHCNCSRRPTSAPRREYKWRHWMTSNDPGCLPLPNGCKCWVTMQPSSQYDVLQQAGLGANHPYVMRNNYWTSPASATAVRQFPYYSKYAFIKLSSWYNCAIVIVCTCTSGTCQQEAKN